MACRLALITSEWAPPAVASFWSGIARICATAARRTVPARAVPPHDHATANAAQVAGQAVGGGAVQDVTVSRLRTANLGSCWDGYFLEIVSAARPKLAAGTGSRCSPYQGPGACTELSRAASRPWRRLRGGLNTVRGATIARCAGCCRRENFGEMYDGARLRRRSAEAQHDGRGCYPKCHAERPVYQLGEQPHEEEEQPGLVHAPLQWAP